MISSLKKLLGLLKFCIKYVLPFVAIWISISAYNNSQLIKELEPDLKIEAKFEKDDNFDNSYLKLINEGPVDAVQVDIQMYQLTYSAALKKVKSAQFGSDQKWYEEKIETKKPYLFDFWYDSFAPEWN